jgi:hypothetical protein
MLRPVGTVYTETSEPSPFDADVRPIRRTWRVVGYAEVYTYGPSGPWETVESLELVARERVSADAESKAPY